VIGGCEQRWRFVPGNDHRTPVGRKPAKQARERVMVGWRDAAVRLIRDEHIRRPGNGERDFGAPELSA
jgi:hypothetical protein